LSERAFRLGRWAAARPALVAAVVYAALSVVFVGQGLLPGRALSSSDGLWAMTPWTASKPPGVKPLGSNFELADAVAVFQPFFEYSRSALPDVPLWNPHIMGGRPYLANAQSAVLSPFSLPAYVLGVWKALAVIAALKLFVAAFGTYLFGRALGLRFGGALLAGVVFSFGTFFVVWLAWPLTNIFPLIPWLLLLTELVVRRPGPLPVAGLGGLVALQFFGGHPETSFHVMFATVVYFLFRVLPRWWRGDRRRSVVLRPMLGLVAALALGAAAAAVTLLPLVELLAVSGDYERRLRSDPSFASSRFLGALFLNDYWGRPTQTPIEAFVSNRGYYAGGITLMLAAAALVLRPTATRGAVAAFGLFCLALALGFEPLARTVVELPGFRTAHNGRMVVFLLFALALLAGWGLDDLSRRRLAARVRRRFVLTAAALIFCVPIIWVIVAGTIDLARLGPALEVAWGFSDPPRASSPLEAAGIAPLVRLNALLQWLPLAGAGLALIALRLPWSRSSRWRLPVRAFVVLATAVLVVDLFRANMGFNPAIPIEHAEQPTTAAIRYLQSRTPNRFTGVDRPGAIQPLGPDLAMRYELYDARGYDYPVVRRFDRLWRATVGPPGDLIPPTTVAQPTRRALRTLSLLSVTDVIQDSEDERLRLPGLRLAYSGPDARIYRNTRALPRAFLVDRQRSVQGEEAALAAVTEDATDTRRVAVIEGRLPGLVEHTLPAPSGGPGTARLVSYEAERVVARASTARPALLVLTDIHYPGWRAWVNGRPVPVERVDYLLRGVLIPPGTHTVELRYRPASWRAGWILSVVAASGLAGIALVGLRRRRARVGGAE
jgi:hypothetical protein